MQSVSYRATVRLAIVSMLAVAAVSPCTHTVEAAPPAVTSPRQLVAEPMVWLVRTDRDWSPVEQAQPTLWIEGQPVTRYVVEKPGVERAFLLGKER